MKKSLLTLAFLSLWFAASEAQTNAIVAERIKQVGALFCANPGGFDTLFSASFLNQVPKQQLTSISQQYYENCGSVTRWKYLDSSNLWKAKVRFFLSKGYSVDMNIGVADAGSHLIIGLLLGPPSPLIGSLTAIVDTMKKLRGKVGFLAAKVTGDNIEPIAELHGNEPLALGSAFKLYVLSTLLKEINEGKRHWNDVIYLDSNSRAFPSGEMHAWPIGTPVTIATAATLMISISDNTATDLLIHTLGRENVEAVLHETSNSHASLDVPFLTTLEMFKLKSGDIHLGRAYEHLSSEQKRTFLSQQVASFSRDSVTFGGEVAMIDSIEWFASPRDIAHVMMYLRDYSTSGEGAKVRGVLSVNPGLDIDKKKWAYAGYKGGSEPGVLNLSFLLQSKSGEWYILTGSWNDNALAVDEGEFEGLMQRAIELLP